MQLCMKKTVTITQWLLDQPGAISALELKGACLDPWPQMGEKLCKRISKAISRIELGTMKFEFWTMVHCFMVRFLPILFSGFFQVPSTLKKCLAKPRREIGHLTSIKSTTGQQSHASTKPWGEKMSMKFGRSFNSHAGFMGRNAQDLLLPKLIMLA